MIELCAYSGKWALAVFLMVAAANAWVEYRDNAIGRYLTKPFLMPFLAVFYLQCAGRPSLLIVAALIFSFFGDVILLGSKKQYLFMFGLVSFLFGHICYIAVFIQSLENLASLPAWSYLFLIPYGIYGLWIYRIIAPNLQVLKVPTVLYMSVILLMSFGSLLRAWAFKSDLSWLPFLGSLLFLASDSLLAIQQFKAGIKYGGVLIMLTYDLGQLLIVRGLI